MDYELHPLCTLFPRIIDDEFLALTADIKTHGLREPIILHEGMILDGGNRYRACIKAGIEPNFLTFGGGNLVEYVLSSNLHRRHLSAAQRSAITAAVTDWANANTHGGDRKGDQEPTLVLDTAKKRAEISNTSKSTQMISKTRSGTTRLIADFSPSTPSFSLETDSRSEAFSLSSKTTF